MVLVFDCVDLNKSYGENVVLHDVNISLPEGVSASLISASGGGKTTLLNIIGGLSAPDTGSVIFEGKDLVDLDEDEQAAVRRKKIGILHQSSYLFPWLSVDENILMTPMGENYDEWIKNMRRGFEIESFSQTPVNKLSGGQRRRVCLLRAFQMGGKLLLLDEPSTGLDSKLRGFLLESINEAKMRGTTVLVATHDPEISNKTDEKIILQNGSVQV
ncbi:MAG: ATP-binding cassette domain-containing protein [Kocuria sp.]|nr:ATP-binding cassette domain-containing protein [Kocuria sp.]